MSNASHLLNQARELFNKKDFGKASETLARVVKLDPKNHEAFYYLGLSYGYGGDKKKSHEALLKSVELKDGNPNYMGDLGVSFFNKGDKDKALRLMDDAQKIDHNNPYRYSSRAYIKASIGDVEGAIVDYEKCLALDKDDSIALNNLGMLLEKKGRIAEAKEKFEIADDLSGGKISDEELQKRRELSAKLYKEKKEMAALDQGIDLDSEAKDGERMSFSYFSEIVKSVLGDKDTMKEFFLFIKKIC